MITAWIFVIGACIGSFLNVVIYRLPRGESVVHPRSRCRCGVPIVWYDNIPIASWFILRGRCRHCGQAFSFRYPMVELGTALVFVGLWQSQTVLPALALMTFASAMIAAAMDASALTTTTFKPLSVARKYGINSSPSPRRSTN